MQVIAALRRLWRHAPFRRLLALRTLSQAADGTLQVGMASYILFSPQSQPDAASIAGVLALTLLPYTLLGPFVAPLLDRWPRRDVALYSDVTRAALAAVIGLIIAAGATTGVWAVTLYVALLLAMSINRFMLAGLSAGLQHTVDADEYLTASSILPTVGPLGVVIGAILGFTTRAVLGGVVPAHQADAVVFGLAAAMFVGSVVVCRGFARGALGPDVAAEHVGVGAVLGGLASAGRHMVSRPASVLALALMAVTRLLFGLWSVAVILAARHLWNPVDRPGQALADLTVWGLFTGAGFVLAAPLVPALVRWLGLRRGASLMLLVAAAVSVGAAFSTAKPVLFAASFLIGLAVQSFKICVDTVVQAHVDEEFKGRAFTFYDMGFNAAFVLSGVVAMGVLPSTGLSAPAFVGVAVGYAACAAVLLAVGRRLGPDVLERGTGDLLRS